jgi:5-methylcytosine-specific restriction endonuclease McrA
MERQEFKPGTKQLALKRQNMRCASCGAHIECLGNAGFVREFGEVTHAHHIRHAKFGGSNALDNCVIICQACHYSVHEGGNYRHGTVIGRRKDFPFFEG